MHANYQAYLPDRFIKFIKSDNVINLSQSCIYMYIVYVYWKQSYVRKVLYDSFPSVSVTKMFSTCSRNKFNPSKTYVLLQNSNKKDRCVTAKSPSAQNTVMYGGWFLPFFFLFFFFFFLDLHGNADLLFFCFSYSFYFFLIFFPYPDVVDKISQDPWIAAFSNLGW